MVTFSCLQRERESFPTFHGSPCTERMLCAHWAISQMQEHQQLQGIGMSQGSINDNFVNTPTIAHKP
eukprot:919190-Amphidinium_carterae.1